MSDQIQPNDSELIRWSVIRDMRNELHICDRVASDRIQFSNCFFNFVSGLINVNQMQHQNKALITAVSFISVMLALENAFVRLRWTVLVGEFIAPSKQDIM